MVVKKTDICRMTTVATAIQTKCMFLRGVISTGACVDVSARPRTSRQGGLYRLYQQALTGTNADSGWAGCQQIIVEMKLVTFSRAGGAAEPGAVIDDGVIGLRAAGFQDII